MKEQLKEYLQITAFTFTAIMFFILIDLIFNI